MMTIADRAAGAVLGALIGDALGLGPHWYYDLAELRKEYGDWIDGYVDPKPGRYHAGMEAGRLDQTGLLLVMLLRSILEHREYVEEDFTRRVDE
jgi:ADP-ribosylglycohydrolase